MFVMTAQQLRDLDARAMSEFGMPGIVLMENAGRAVVEVARREFGPLAGKRIAVFCGSGNNGGDGYAILRLLVLEGARPTLFWSDAALKRGRLKPDTETNVGVAIKTGGYERAALPNDPESPSSQDWRR